MDDLSHVFVKSPGDSDESRFTYEEKNKLKKLALEYEVIIKDKGNNNEIKKKKNEAWRVITDRFNATQINGRDKSTEKLKNKWKNIMRDCKTAKSKEKQSVYRTGGGQNEIIASEIDHRIADAFAKEIFPLNNTEDSDSNFHGKDVILVDSVNKENNNNEKPKSPARKQKSNTSPAPKRIKVEMDNNYQIQMLENVMKKSN